MTDDILDVGALQTELLNLQKKYDKLRDVSFELASSILHSDHLKDCLQGSAVCSCRYESNLCNFAVEVMDANNT